MLRTLQNGIVLCNAARKDRQAISPATQFIGHPHLPVGRKLHRVRPPQAPSVSGSTRFFRLGLLRVRSRSASTPPSGHSVSVAIECVPRQAHDLTGFRDIAQFLGKVQKSYFVFDDSFVTLKHEGYLSWCFDRLVCTAIKTGNPRFCKRSVRSSRN